MYYYILSLWTIVGKKEYKNHCIRRDDPPLSRAIHTLPTQKGSLVLGIWGSWFDPPTRVHKAVFFRMSQLP